MNARFDPARLEAGSAVAGKRVVVVGAGPSGVRVAQELCGRGCDVTLFNAERWTAQNRVQLTPLLAGDVQIGAVAQAPVFRGPGRVKLYSDNSIVDIDQKAKTVTSRYGRIWPYDDLVLCMGSRPHVPPIPGVELSGVFRFRNIDDVEKLVARSFSARRAVVIGGGLLGLEAARGIARRGAYTTVIEHEAHLMARQLDGRAGALLAARIEAMGLAVKTGCAVARIEGRARVERLALANGEILACDTVVICTGVRANIELARDIGLAVGRGITVSASMQTSDPHIYAIGECAEFSGQLNGLVGPGFEQAAVAARNIVDGGASYTPSPPATKLKLIGADVFSMGEVDQIDQNVDVRTIQYESPDGLVYRRLALRQGRLVAAVAIGEWSEISRVQRALRETARLSPLSRMRFSRSGQLWSASGPSPVADWPDVATVCNCTAVTRGQISSAIVAGCRTLEAVRAETAASTVCGSCRPLIEELLCTAPTRAPLTLGRLLATISVIAALVVVMALAAPAWPLATSITAVGLPERLWLEDWPKQVSGFSLLSVFTLAAALSLRKRIRRFSLGAFASWRAIHAVIGAAALLAFFAHTGFRFGSNLNAALSLTFAGLAFAGGLAGLAMAIEHRTEIGATAAARLRTASFWLHVVLLWPLPALLCLHIFSAYYY